MPCPNLLFDPLFSGIEPQLSIGQVLKIEICLGVFSLRLLMMDTYKKIDSECYS